MHACVVSDRVSGALGAVPLTLHFFASGGYTNKLEAMRPPHIHKPLPAFSHSRPCTATSSRR